MRRPLILLVVACAACSPGASAPPAAPADAAAPRKAAPPPPPPGRVVYDLLANRPLACVHAGDSLILDGASADFWKWIDGGWKASFVPLGHDAARSDGRAVALVAGIAGVVRFPLDKDDPALAGDLELAFTARPAVDKQNLSIFWNEKPLANLALQDGYHEYQVAVPAARALAGENSVRFHFRAAGTIDGRHSAAAFERIRVGPRGARDPGVLPKLGQGYGIAGDVRRSLAAPLPARFSYYLEVPPSVRLELAYGADGRPAAGAPPTRFAVRAISDGEREARELWHADAGTDWQRASIDLAPLAGRTVRLDLVIANGGGAFAEPRIVADAKPPPRPVGKAAEHVLVWMVDTLRADRLRDWNDKSQTKTPGFDQLGREATRFAATTVQGNYSLPSHTSLLTGVLPSVHKMYDDKDRLPEALPLVAQDFQRAGFATALFSSNGYVSDKWGFKKGWGAYRNFIREDKPNSASEVWKAAKPWLAEQVQQHRRTFMYLATVDPHVAYNPPERFLKEYWPKPYHGPVKPALTSQQLYQIKIGRLKLGDEDKRYLEALYDAEVTQNDTTFRDLVADLKQMGIYDATAIVLISDHGDEFFDHGSVGHGHSLYQELIDVPMEIRFPPRMPEGKRVAQSVEVIDLTPTLLDLAGIDPGEEEQGQSLLPIAADDGPEMARPAESFHDGAIRSLRLGRWKLILWAGGRLQLYDLAADPGEKHDRSGDRPIALRWLRNVFAYYHAYNERWRKARWGVASDLKPAFADDLGM